MTDVRERESSAESMLNYLRDNERHIGWVSSRETTDSEGHLLIGIDGGIDLTTLSAIATEDVERKLSVVAAIVGDIPEDSLGAGITLSGLAVAKLREALT